MTDDISSEQIRGKYWDFFLELGIPPETLNSYMGQPGSFMVTVYTRDGVERPEISISCDGIWRHAYEGFNENDPTITPDVIMESVHTEIVRHLGCGQWEHYDNFKDWRKFGQIRCDFQGPKEKIFDAMDKAFKEYYKVHNSLVELTGTLRGAYRLGLHFLQNTAKEITDPVCRALGNEGDALREMSIAFYKSHQNCTFDFGNKETVTQGKEIFRLFKKGLEAAAKQQEDILKNLEKISMGGFDMNHFLGN